MLKRIKKRWIVTIALIIAVLLFFLIFHDFSPRLASKAWETGNLTKSVTVFESSGDYTPSEPPASMELVIKKGFLALFTDMKTGDFALEDMRSGTFWYTTPLKADEDELARGNYKNEMYSVLTVNDIVIESHTQKKRNSKIGSVNKNDAKVTRTENGININYNFSDQKYSVPVDIQLLEDSLKVSVDSSKITESGDEKIFSIALLPYFGAQDSETVGKIILPDGSGSEMDLNNGKNSQSYRVPLFGDDAVSVNDSKPTETQKASLPIFGILNDKSEGLLAVVEDGAASAYINAASAGNTTSYNNVYADFNLRMKQTSTLGTGWNSRDISLYDEVPISPDFYSVRYFPAEKAKATTAGLAGMMREYLLVQEGMKPANLDVSPLFIETTGAVRTRESILGVKTDKNRAVTTFKQAEKISEELKALGVDSMFWSYDGWSTDELKGKVAADLNIAGIIGGNKGMNSFNSYLSGINSRLFLKEESVNYMKSGSGAVVLQDSVKDLSATAVKTKEYKLNTYFPDSKSDTGRLLVGTKAHSAFERLVASANKENVGLGLGSIGSTLYSSFGGNRYSRTAMAENTKAVLKGSGTTYLGDNPSFYALSSCNSVINLPDSGSAYDICDRSVPFLHMVLHGVVPYSGTPINQSGYSEDSLLFSVRTGSFLNYSLSGIEPVKLKDYGFTDMYGASVELWKTEIADSYNKLKDYYAKTREAYIDGYEELAYGVTLTVFSNGEQVLVNSSDSSYTHEGVTVHSKDFKVIGG